MSRSRVNQAQMNKLLDLLSADGVLVNGKVTYSNTNKQAFWKQIALQLNSMEEGVYKSTWKWCKMWADWKTKTKKKANILLRMKQYSYVQQVSPLNDLELRLLKMIDYPLEEKNVFNLAMVNKVELPDATAGEITDFLTEGYDAPLSPDNMSSDEEDNKPTGYSAKSKMCDDDDDDDMLEDGDSKHDVDEEYLNAEKTVKMKGKQDKKKLSLEEIKFKTTLALEKEKVQQKSEELRLRALELKLKGDELRMQEMEMKKINQLTNIEEEKLKCFKDISASLKELLDRTRNGNVRFHNVL